MRRIARVAVAATALVALGILTSWMTIGGGSTNIAFAEVAEALDSLRSATYDMTMETKGEDGQSTSTAVTLTAKGFFLAPSLYRMEMTCTAEATAATVPSLGVTFDIPKVTLRQVAIVDDQATKGITLTPSLKFAWLMDMKQWWADMKKSGKADPFSPQNPSDLFEMIRRLIREGSTGTGAKAERLGKREIDGREAVGFRIRSNMSDMVVWADPRTARPIRVEVDSGSPGDKVPDTHAVVNNFRYNVDLDPSLFSLEPPAGYSVLATEITMPMEEDLLANLRTIAEHRKGEFPAELGMNSEVTEPLLAGLASNSMEMDPIPQDKIAAVVNDVMAKYGGMEQLLAKHGGEVPPAIKADIKAEIQKGLAPLVQKHIQEQMPTSTKMQEYMERQIKEGPLRQERIQGITFYMELKPENDPHYVGSGVKLGTPDRPIFWYRPTGADQYRVIYADLSVKDMAPDDVKKLPQATGR